MPRPASIPYGHQQLISLARPTEPRERTRDGDPDEGNRPGPVRRTRCAVAREVDPPVAGDREVLVRVRAASVNPHDWHAAGHPYLAWLMRLAVRVRRPKQSILGPDLAGQVEAVGSGVTRLASRRRGVRYARRRVRGVRVRAGGPGGPKPANLTFEQAAAVPLAALTALQGLRDKGKCAPGTGS